MQLTIPHKLTKGEAKTNIDTIVENARTQGASQGITLNDAHWEDDTLHFDVSGQGQRVTGTATVLEQAYDVNVKLPLMMRMFEGRIKKMLEEQTKALGSGQ